MTFTPLRRIALAAVATATLIASGCGSDADTGADPDPTDSDGAASFSGEIRIGAIPDQDPEKLARTYGLVASYLEEALPGVTVEYVPVTDYKGAIASFGSGDLDLVWFGGLTGVQARREVEGSVALAQRDIDATFTSVFIANTSAGIEPFGDVAGLSAIAGHSFTFGSESSTSGRLMPQFFLDQAGVDVETDLTGPAAFSDSHDKTLEVVMAGSFETGALNSQVWDSAVADGTVDDTKVVEVFRTPEYFDYHWVAQPELDDTLGADATDALREAFLALDGDSPEETEILELFGAGSFIATEASNYESIEKVARDIGVIRD